MSYASEFHVFGIHFHFQNLGFELVERDELEFVYFFRDFDDEPPAVVPLMNCEYLMCAITIMNIFENIYHKTYLHF